MNIPAQHRNGFDLSKQTDRLALTSILASQGFPIRAPRPGEGFSEGIRATLADFQACHRGQDGKPLAVDGIPGPKTTWALFNPSGSAQAPRIAGEGFNPAALAKGGKRAKFIAEMVKCIGIAENPDGSNWGGGVEKILAHAGGPRAWCMHLISYCWKNAFGEYPFNVDHGHVATFLSRCREQGIAYKRDEYKPKSGDFGVILYRDKKTGQYDGTGHIFAVADGPESGPLLTIAGNEGNACRWGERNRSSRMITHWINPYGDGKAWKAIKIVEGRKVVAADDSAAGTR